MNDKKVDFENRTKNSISEIELLNSLEDLNAFEKKYLKGKESLFSYLLSDLSAIKEKEKKKCFGNKINDWKKVLQLKIKCLKEKFIEKQKEKNTINSSNSFSLREERIELGNFHPIRKSLFEIYDFFISMGYKVFDCEEIENKWYNFDSLNIEKNHPARKPSDTFYFSKDLNLLLRTHTSNCQVRIMERNIDKNLMVVSGGKVYRNDDDDFTHSHQYTNLEIINIGKNINFANLKWTLEKFFEWFFGNNIKLNFRPSFFPFTEPSFEIDISCMICKYKSNDYNCSVCKNTRWIEILGAGLINSKVLKNAGYNWKKFSGFAVGIGIERILMIKYGIKDIREFYLSDLRFLKQTKWS